MNKCAVYYLIILSYCWCVAAAPSQAEVLKAEVLRVGFSGSKLEKAAAQRSVNDILPMLPAGFSVELVDFSFHSPSQVAAVAAAGALPDVVLIAHTEMKHAEPFLRHIVPAQAAIASADRRFAGLSRTGEDSPGPLLYQRPENDTANGTKRAHQYSPLEEFHPLALQAMHHKDQLKGLPWFCITPVMYVNTEAFHRSHVPIPRFGWTWNDFVVAASALTLRDAEGTTTQWGYMSLHDQYEEDAAWITLAGGTWGPNMYYEAGSLEAGTIAMRFASDLVYRYKVSPTPEVWSSMYLNGRPHRPYRHSSFFTEGEFAMFKGSTWHLFELHNSGPSVAWDIVPLPALKRSSANVTVYGLGITKTSAHPEVALKLASLLIQHPERGVPALRTDPVKAKFLTAFGLENKNVTPLFAALRDGILTPVSQRDPRLNQESVRTRPWYIKRQPWTVDSAVKYRRVIEQFRTEATAPK